MKPPITVSSYDLERLETLIDSQPVASPAAQALLEELGRAEVVEPDQLPPTVVTMNSKVRFAIDNPPSEFCLELVYPREMQEGQDGERISVLSPVGSALLGLSVGSRIDWPRPGGGMVKVTLLEVMRQPKPPEEKAS